ncbi:uncharacterized protein LOC129614761 [Condylostylus longicornis]|uniref:uncharacterized protein LOC129614761 n=1 Tax=Condylostylus longicornis TaxID=2530218 RepID=UPI00244E0833|nr:uncharacterized protein LOC129614761 [Condylostylus longicornis]
MAKTRKETTIEEREIIVKLNYKGKSVRQIGEIIGRSFSTIVQIINRAENSGTVENPHRIGRPSKMDDRTNRGVLQELGKNPKLSAPKLVASTSQKLHTDIHAEAIRRFLWQEGYHGRSAKKLVLGSTWVFQQDNDPKHTARVAKEWRLYNDPKQLHSQPQSPDLNPIEHLWDFLEQKIRKHDITGKESLKRVIIEEWHKIPSTVICNLVQSMPRRLEAVLQAKGGPTRY